MEPSPTTARDPDDWWWIFDPRQSLRARAVAIFGGLALGFSLLLGWTADTIFRRHLARQLGPSFEALAFQVGDKLDRAIDDRLRALNLAAGLAALKNPATPAAERRAVLDALLDASPDFAWVGFVDRAGRVVAATEHLFEETSVADRPWFRGARRAAYTGGVHESAELAREVQNFSGEKPRFLDLAVPITDTDGNSLGVLGAHVRWLAAREAQLSVVPETTARREHIDITLYAPDGDVLLDSGVSGWNHPPNAPAIGEKPGTRGYLTETVAGDTDYLTGYIRTKGYREFRGANWLITVRQPVADAFAPVRDLQRWIFRLGVLFTVGVAVVSWLVAGRITRRMAGIATAASRIRAGDVLSEMPRPPGEGEIQSMCEALGTMVEDLRAKNEQLDAENTKLNSRLHERDGAEKPGA
jgi:HAMP domain-containing protein